MKPLCKWTTHIASVKDIVPTLESAFKEAQEGTPGPVFVEVPIDILYKEQVCRDNLPKDGGKSMSARFINWYINRHIEKIFGVNEITFSKPLDFHIPNASDGQIKKTIQYLKQAKKPVLMVGSQSILQNNTVMSGQLADAINKMGIPTFVSGMGRGLLGRDSKTQYRHKDTRRKALREADVVILAGLPCDFRLNYGRNINSRAVLISANRDSTDLTKNRKPTVAILGDPSDFIVRLSSALGSIADNCKPWHAELSSLEGD